MNTLQAIQTGQKALAFAEQQTWLHEIIDNWLGLEPTVLMKVQNLHYQRAHGGTWVCPPNAATEEVKVHAVAFPEPTEEQAIAFKAAVGMSWIDWLAKLPALIEFIRAILGK